MPATLHKEILIYMEMKTSYLFLYIKIYRKFQKKVLISFEDLSIISNFSKFCGCCSKIELAMPISILNFEWMWQAQFYRYLHKTLENYLYSINEQMILLPCLHISKQKLENLEKPIFSLNSSPLTVESERLSTVSGLE